MNTNQTDESLRYPIGKYEPPAAPLSPAERIGYVQQIADLPTQVLALARQIGGVRLEQPYRSGGWNGRQVIHHLADSHLNSYTRYKLALTEENPTIRPYDETAWAELPDVAATPITVSLDLLTALHMRWTTLLHHLSEAQWQRTFFHPESKHTFTLEQATVLYAWHGRHHLGHLQLLAG